MQQQPSSATDQNGSGLTTTTSTSSGSSHPTRPSQVKLEEDEKPQQPPTEETKPSSSSTSTLLKVRLINIDHVTIKPGPHDRVDCAFLPPGESLRKVPVLRIFGATPAGQRVCLHLHGIFPYCYIPYEGSLEPDRVLQYIQRLGSELNAAVTASLRGNPAAPESYHHIAAIHLVKGVPFYGYHVGWRHYLKISFVDPSHNFRLATILQSGRVMRTEFQPFEIHIRYQLQFMLDYNVFGCDYMELKEAHFRLPLPPASEYLGTPGSHWDEATVPGRLIQPDSVHRTSYCELEVDAVAKHVLNRRNLKPRYIHHDFDEDETLGVNEKLVPSLSGLWEEEAARRVKAGLDPTPPVTDPSKDQRTLGEGEAPEWMAEDRLRALLEARLTLEARNVGVKRPRDFTKPHPLDDHVATTFDSVEIFHWTSAELAAEAARGGLTAGTQIPSTLYDLEHLVTQGKSSTSSSSAKSAKEESLDAEFFSTQAFQSDIAELERQLAKDDNSDAGSDHDAAADEEHLMGQEPGSAPQTPRKKYPGSASSTPRTPRTFTPDLTQPPKTPHKTPLTRSAFRTPARALASDTTVRFQSPLRGQDSPSASALIEGEDRAPSSSNERPLSSGSPLPLSLEQQDDESSQQPNGENPISQQDSLPSSDQSPAKMGSSQWLRAHIKAQARWRESAQAVIAATQALDEGSKSKFNRRQSQRAPQSTVPALTQLARSGTSSLMSNRSGLTSSNGSGDRIEGPKTRTYTYAIPAPTKLEVTASMKLFGVAPVEYQDPYYSNAADVPPYAREYAGRSWRFASKTIKYLAGFPGSFDPKLGRHRAVTEPAHIVRRGATSWQYGPPPPVRVVVQDWATSQRRRRKKIAKIRKQRAAGQMLPTPSNRSGTQRASFGFKLSQRKPAQVVVREKQHMTVFAIEVHVNTRGEFLPDPKKDAVQAIVYSFQNEDEFLEDTGSRPGVHTGLILLQNDKYPLYTDRLGLAHYPVQIVDTELELFNCLIDVVRGFDPEILVGFEIHQASWGYVIDRARHHLEFDLVPELSRVNNQSTGSAGGKNDNWGWTQTSALKITGRHILNIWRLMRGELNLNVYTYENIVFHLLRSRVPRFPASVLTMWYSSGRAGLISRVLQYWIERAETDLLLIETSELVFRTAEFARIYGIDFFSVISRGSQFKVESVMFRIAKPESFLLPSPNTKQVAEQNAAECLPLIMEPQSAFYKGPLLVLDFQSLYPSVMIAYNLCYSTCLGRVTKFQSTDKFGITELKLPPGLLTLLKDDINISPNGLIFVKPHIRRSLLAKMLTEILDTRVMIKGSMKGQKGNKSFLRLQNARQLSLKLLANVTYGYTSATFSGRMPCVEIADAIVQTGRETLERAIATIHATEKWGAQVVYGDTDSLFIYLPQRSKDDAFRIGNEIADAVTRQNPKPIKLKFEKVYLPSVLLAKKRYVGFKYEAVDEKVPEFNAKGIETVRRDGFPALQKMLEACIRLLFTTQDLSLVKSYCQKQWKAILSGNVALPNFIIAKEVRLGGYSENGVPPPGAAVSARRMLLDHRSEPQHAERVQYLITQGEPKAKLNDLAVEPLIMVANPQLQLNALYYIQRGVIPPLTRVFNLLGADVEAWFKEMPRLTNMGVNNGLLPIQSSPTSNPTSRLTLTDHYRQDVCLSCGRQTENELCLDCRQSPSSTLYSLFVSQRMASHRLQTVEQVCANCSRLTSIEVSPCKSTDCPVFYDRMACRRREEMGRERLRRVEIVLEEGS